MDATVKCSHILQKHIKSRNPFDSYRNKKITRTEEEALDNIKNIRKSLLEKGLTTFGEFANKFSECSSAKNYGDLGDFGKGQMQKEFEVIAFSLKIGELSEPVFTASGVHIILRTG